MCTVLLYVYEFLKIIHRIIINILDDLCEVCKDGLDPERSIIPTAFYIVQRILHSKSLCRLYGLS